MIQRGRLWHSGGQILSEFVFGIKCFGFAGTFVESGGSMATFWGTQSDWLPFLLLKLNDLLDLFLLLFLRPTFTLILNVSFKLILLTLAFFLLAVITFCCGSRAAEILRTKFVLNEERGPLKVLDS